MHSDVSSTIYAEFTMEPDNNHVFQPLSLAIILLYTFFLSKAKKEAKLKPVEQYNRYFELVG